MNDLIQKLGQTRTAIGIGLLCSILVSLLFSAGIFEQLELKSLDHRFDMYAERLKPSQDIVIVTIDQNSIDYLKNDMQILWKWPRDVYAHTIDYLTASGASAIVLDFDFSDPDINRAEFEEGQTDIMLGQSIEDSAIVITSALFDPSKNAGQFALDSTDYELLDGFSMPADDISPHIPIAKAEHVYAPIPEIMEFSRFVGASNIYTDMDGTVRRLRLFQSYDDGVYPATPLASVLTATNQVSPPTISEDSLLTIGNVKIPLGRQGDFYINWYGAGGPKGRTFKYYPIADVLLSQLRTLDGLDPILPPDKFEGKMVFIGSNAASLYDLKPTPMSIHGEFPGVEILATAANNILDGSTLGRETGTSAVILILLLCLTTAALTQTVKSPIKSVPLALALLIACYLYAVIRFYDNVFINLVPIQLGVALSFISVTLMNYLTEGKEKARVKKAFSQYTSSALMDEILKNPAMLKLGGEKRELSILFSDIRSFTSISEKLTPEQLTQMLNEYLTPMTDIVFRHKGILDKYIGDAIMALFGAPLPLDNHPAAACHAALDMIDDLHTLRSRWKDEERPEFIQNMSIGIGINSGPVSVGNMGSTARFDYTVIGDNVNLSSRLESTTKAYGVNIIISQNTYEQTGNVFLVRELDLIRVVGKKEPVTMYELISVLKGAEQSDIDNAAAFKSALALYRNRNFTGALEAFNAYKLNNTDDKTTDIYIQRCNSFMEVPPPDDWDWVYERRSK